MSSQLSDAGLSRLSPDQACRALANLAERVGVDVVRDAMFHAVAKSAFPSDVVKSAVLAGGFGHGAPAPANGIDGGHHHSIEEAENAHQSTGIHKTDNENDHEMTDMVPRGTPVDEEAFADGATDTIAAADPSEEKALVDSTSHPSTAKKTSKKQRLRKGSDGIYRTGMAMKHWNRNRKKKLQRDLAYFYG